MRYKGLNCSVELGMILCWFNLFSFPECHITMLYQITHTDTEGYGVHGRASVFDILGMRLGWLAYHCEWTLSYYEYSFHPLLTKARELDRTWTFCLNDREPEMSCDIVLGIGSRTWICTEHMFTSQQVSHFSKNCHLTIKQYCCLLV